MRRVVVTGLGAVSPFGAGVKAYWAGLAAGACAIRPLTLFESEGFRCRIAAEVPELTAGSPRRSRADRLALGAALVLVPSRRVGFRRQPHPIDGGERQVGMGLPGLGSRLPLVGSSAAMVDEEVGEGPHEGGRVRVR